LLYHDGIAVVTPNFCTGKVDHDGRASGDISGLQFHALAAKEELAVEDRREARKLRQFWGDYEMVCAQTRLSYTVVVYVTSMYVWNLFVTNSGIFFCSRRVLQHLHVFRGTVGRNLLNE
jgi:hypothetical protein